jgi:hypothetical protein
MRIIDGELVWSMKATHGVPLDFVLQQLAAADTVPAWDGLFSAALRDGANLDKLVRELNFFVREAYRADIAEQINARMPMVPAYVRQSTQEH